MPYTFKKAGKKVKVIKKATGEVVANAKSMSGAKGYAWHAENAK
jgi:hypothetical protein